MKGNEKIPEVNDCIYDILPSKTYIISLDKNIDTFAVLIEAEMM
jgi:hypothetical protein